MTVNTDEASIAHPLLTSCCAAVFLTGSGLWPGGWGPLPQMPSSDPDWSRWLSLILSPFHTVLCPPAVTRVTSPHPLGHVPSALPPDPTGTNSKMSHVLQTWPLFPVPSTTQGLGCVESASLFTVSNVV